ncbi:hypothetical protein BJV77DRAFT_1071204 [Russula vinacea]|nr:hypothetical protein BJV77DRAFT_1071204 [Russula vinacea]
MSKVLFSLFKVAVKINKCRSARPLHFPASVWAAAPHLALAELGIDADFSEVNLIEGANFNPEFLKLNPNATLPTLTHGGKSYQSTAEVIDYLVSVSSTKVAPETSITKVVHEERVDPNFAFCAARNDDELAQVSGSFANVFHTTRLGHLKRYAATPEGQANKPFYDRQIAKISGLHALLNGQAPDDAKQDTPRAIAEGPFIGGGRPGVDDFHVGAWIARIAFVSGAQKSEEDPNLEAFYAELDARMAMPDYWNLSNFFDHRRNTSGSFEPLPSIDNQVPSVDLLLLPSKRKASPGSEQPLSEKRGKHLQSPTPVAGEGHKDKTANTSTVASTAASIQDVTSIIEEFTDVIAESPVAKRVSEAKTRTLLEKQASSLLQGGEPMIVLVPRLPSSGQRLRLQRRRNSLQRERRLEQAVTADSLPPPPPHIDGRKARQSSAKLPITKAVQLPQHLKGYVIFYTGGDLTYASARTRGCMNYVRVLRVTFLSHFDPATATHIVTEANEKNTLRALGLKSLSEIPLEIPTVYWSWVISGKQIPGEKDKQQMDYEFMHAAFPSRMDAGRPLTAKGKGKQIAINVDQVQPGKTPPRAASPNPSSSRGSSCGIDEEVPGALSEQPPLETRKGRDTLVTGPSRRKSRSPLSAQVKSTSRKSQESGYVCDDPTGTAAANSAPCVNQDIVDKLSELAELHRAKPTQDDKWRVLGYTKGLS